MNGPCSLHPESYIADTGLVVEADHPELPRPVRATRKTVFHRYCEALALEGEVEIIYEGTQDIMTAANNCAATIMADKCPMYVVAQNRQKGNARIIHRADLEKYANRYTQLIN